MKQCSICKEEKSLDLFNKNKTKKDGYQTMCKPCSQARSRKYYKDNHDKQLKEVYKRKRKVVKEHRHFLFDFYKNNPCVDCGETDPIVLELDHQRDKVMEVSRMVNNGWSKNKVLDEIAKCEVRCANCHRRKTAKDQGWYKDILGS
jgi:hypothetical protein